MARFLLFKRLLGQAFLLFYLLDLIFGLLDFFLRLIELFLAML